MCIICQSGVAPDDSALCFVGFAQRTQLRVSLPLFAELETQAAAVAAAKAMEEFDWLTKNDETITQARQEATEAAMVALVGFINGAAVRIC